MLSPLFLMIGLEALYREISSGHQEELLDPDDLALVSETLQALKKRLEAWKGGALEERSFD